MRLVRHSRRRLASASAAPCASAPRRTACAGDGRTCARPATFTARSAPLCACRARLRTRRRLPSTRRGQSAPTRTCTLSASIRRRCGHTTRAQSTTRSMSTCMKVGWKTATCRHRTARQRTDGRAAAHFSRRSRRATRRQARCGASVIPQAATATARPWPSPRRWREPHARGALCGRADGGRS